jgi:tetratricopeptide (TPR) repeat protein
MKQKKKGCSIKHSTALVLWILLVTTCASRAAQQEKSPGISVPGECAAGNGSLQQFGIPTAPDPLGSTSNQHYERGIQLLSSGDRTAAEREFRQAVDLRPTHPQFVDSLAKLYITEGRANAALDVVRDYTRICGATALGYALEGEVLFQRRQYEDAKGAILSSLDIFPNNARMHQLLGLILLLNGDKLDASLELEKAESLSPNDAEIRYFYGRALYLNGHYPEARDQFLACLEADPQYRKALENLGLTYQALGDYGRASKSYEQAIEREQSQPSNTKHGEPFGYYGSMLLEMNEPDRALQVLREGVAASPRSLIVNFELGRVLYALNRPDQARDYLVVAEDLAPSYAQTHYLLGRLYGKQQQEQKAKQEFEKFQQLAKDPANREFPLTDR